MRPSLRELFFGFLECALSGFGGVLAWSHRTLVERRGWLTEQEFAEVLGLSQIVPGGNIINIAIFIGLRFQGMPGVFASLAGLLIVPFCLLLALNAVATQATHFTQPALRGAGPVVAGLLLTTGVKMLRAYRWTPPAALISTATTIAVALLALPLIIVLAVVAPISMFVMSRTK